MEDNTPESPNLDAASPPAAAALRELEERARTALSAQRGQMSRLEAEITHQLEAITSAIANQQSAESEEAEQAATAGAEMERLRRETDEARAAWQRERAEQEAKLAERMAELEKLSADQADQARQLAKLGRELDERHTALEKQNAALSEREAALSRRAEDLDHAHDQQHANKEDFAARESAWNAERKSLETARDELLEKITRLEAQHQASKDEWQTQLLDFERRLAAQQSSWGDQRSELAGTQSELERERDELKQKFELALQDVQRFRGRAADLEQELARRPETNQGDSAELVALRAERDALAERVEQLERQPVGQLDANTEQQISDLQRRFELAVEDVRELKTKNAQLEAKLAAAAQRPGPKAETGGSDWESLKRKMLASLEEETDNAIDEERTKERTTIERTIEMTDAVVADKDRQIDELKTQLAGIDSAKKGSEQDEQDERINKLIDADEVIAEHRKRITQLEREMQDKLRAAELEISVERAKLARHKAELEELRSDLESQQQSRDPHGAAAGTPRRRWLSKLGLSGEEQG